MTSATLLIVPGLSVAGPRMLPAVLMLVLLVGASIFDMRERRLPNAYAAVMLAVSVVATLACAGMEVLLANGVTVAVITLALVGFELGYRRVRGSSGMGMGDIKALVPLMVVNPSCALIAFAVGLLALALAGLLLHRRALPFLPFLTLGWLLMGCLGTCSV